MPANRLGSTSLAETRRKRMSPSNRVGRRVAARVAVASIVVSVVTGCTGVDASVPPASVKPSATGVASPSASLLPTPVARPAAFPTEDFGALSEGPVPGDVAARFQEVLDDMAVGGGVAATVMTPFGTWSGAAGTADGIHDVAVDSQFGIASG